MSLSMLGVCLILEQSGVFVPCASGYLGNMIRVTQHYNDKKKKDGVKIVGKIPIELEGEFDCSGIKYCYKDKNFEYKKNLLFRLLL